MGRGTAGVAAAPPIVADSADDDRHRLATAAHRGDSDDDHRLVAAVRRGDDRAFEALYARYQRRIGAYVLGMVKDHGRAEDVTQEVFVAALRRMRETERPIAFKPWIYEIAKNACIDQFRRSRRTEEVSYDAAEALAPSDLGKLVGSDPQPDAAVAAKQDLDTLCGAFGGLSDTHHEILVLRELEGLSYREIGDRMGMSRPAVESTLFRARRRLTEEYDDLVTGARCERIHRVIQAAAGGRLGTRETRRLARHVSHCQPCRREALAAGLDASILTHVPLRRRAAEKIAGLLPLPGFLRIGRGSGAPPSNWFAQLPAFSEQLGGGWAKLATAAAVVVAGLGAAGVGTQVGDDSQARERAATERPATAGGARDGATVRSTPAAAKTDRSTARGDTHQQGTDAGRAGGGSSAGGGTDSKADGGSTSPTSEGGGGAADNAPGSGTSGGPSVDVPTSSDPAKALQPVTDTVKETTAPVTDAVKETTAPVTDAVKETTAPVTGAVNETTAPVTDSVNETTAPVTGPVQETTDPVVGAVGEATEPVTNAANDATNGATEPATDAVDGLIP